MKQLSEEESKLIEDYGQSGRVGSNWYRQKKYNKMTEL